MNVWIVIAAYNEESVIGDVVKELLKAKYDNIVVVDDGSKDKTAEVAREAKAHVVVHEVNQGQGAGLRTGIQYALKHGADIIVTFDADGQHRVEDLPVMIAPVASGEVDVSLGSRFLGKKSNIPFFRRLTLKIGILVVWLFYGVKLTDVHNGFRAFSRSAAEKIRITCPRMEHASEIIYEIKRNKLKFKEVPIVIRYTEYAKQHGQSSWNAFRILWRMILHRLRV